MLITLDEWNDDDELLATNEMYNKKHLKCTASKGIKKKWNTIIETNEICWKIDGRQKAAIKMTTDSIIMYCNNFYCFESETVAYRMRQLAISMYWRFTVKFIIIL